LDRLVAVAHQIGDVRGIVTMFDDGQPITPAIDALPRIVSSLGRLGPVSLGARRWLLPLYPAAVQWLSGSIADLHRRQPIDLLVSTSSAAIKGLEAPPGVPHVCYCHAPARYLWSLGAEYAEGSTARRVGLEIFGDALREWDRASAAHVDQFMANSTATRNVIERAWGRDSQIVFPPVRTQYFTPPQSRREAGAPWLVVSALEPYKRVESAIHAANHTGHQLVVAGTGSERARLQSLCGPTVQMVGRVADAELRRLYRTSRCLIFPQIEDFGIVAVEAQACGLPVVAFSRGGALDTVVDGVTGSFFHTADSESLIDAVNRCPQPDNPQIVEHAQQFSEDRFDHEARAVLLQALRGARGRDRLVIARQHLTDEEFKVGLEVNVTNHLAIEAE